MRSEKKRGDEALKNYLSKLEIVGKANEVNPFESPAEQEARIKRAKTDVVYFVHTYLPHYATAPCAGFQIRAAGEIASNVFIKFFAQWGRGLAKSVWCDIIIPLWLYARGEEVFMCLKSDSKERAQELLMDVQAELEANPLFIHDFGKQKCEGSWEIGNFKTIHQRFIGMAFGIKQKVRGLRVKQRRPNLWVIDDLETPDTIANPKRMRRQAEHIERDVLPTMTGKTGRLLYANNRFARVMTQTILQERHPHWKVHQVEAYNKVTHEPAWKGMYTSDYYVQQEKDMGIPGAYAEYLHETKIEGAIFSEDQIQWTKIPVLTAFKMIVSHWDIAYTDNEKSDYNAVKAWGLLDNNFYLIDSYVKQSKMKQAVAWMCEFKKRIPQGTNIIFQYESQFWNGEVQRAIDEVEIAYNTSLNLMKIDTPHTNKFGRIVTLQPYYQNSRIYYNEALKSHADTQVGTMQLCAIEEGSGEHDDSPDADQQAIKQLEKYTTSSRRQQTGGKCFRVGKMKLTHELP
jgi:phage terminase large subunit-like protein